MQKELFVSSLILGLMVGHGVMAVGSDTAGGNNSTEAISASSKQGVTEVIPVHLTIQDAVYRAFANNPAVKMAGYNLNAARATMNAVRMSRGITITGGLTWDKNGTTTDRYSFTDGDYGYRTTYGRTRTQGITATLPIYTGGEYRGKLITEKANYQGAISGKQKAYNDMHYSVVNSYYTCLLKKDLERVAQDSVNTLASHLKNVQASYAVGVVAKVDVLRSEVELADAQQNLIKAENERKSAVHTLNKIIGLPLETEVNLTDTLSNEEYGRDLAACLEFAELNRPDLEQSRQSVRAAKGGVRTARSGYMPKVNVTASKKWNYTSQSQQAHEPSNSNTWDAGITATWTAFDSGVTAYKVHAAEMKTRVAKEKLRDDENSVALDVRNTYYKMQESQRRIHTTDVAVSKAQEDYDIAQLRYRNGVGTNTDVMDAQVALNKAKTNYIQACYDFNTSKIALDNAIGVPFKSPLEQTVVKPVKMKVRVGDKVKIVEEGKNK